MILILTVEKYALRNFIFQWISIKNKWSMYWTNVQEIVTTDPKYNPLEALIYGDIKYFTGDREKNTAPSLKVKYGSISIVEKNTAPSSKAKNTAPSCNVKNTVPSSEVKNWKNTAPSSKAKSTALSCKVKHTGPSSKVRNMDPSP